eukprot:c2088_g1_i1.p1 GENE.c2088_g1_i1~~c2088_g1_i1.p1  ORF type:complete len:171 (+),score=42.26 c2088_g1_i1:27-539(+)
MEEPAAHHSAHFPSKHRKISTEIEPPASSISEPLGRRALPPTQIDSLRSFAPQARFSEGLLPNYVSPLVLQERSGKVINSPSSTVSRGSSNPSSSPANSPPLIRKLIHENQTLMKSNVKLLTQLETNYCEMVKLKEAMEMVKADVLQLEHANQLLADQIEHKNKLLPSPP